MTLSFGLPTTIDMNGTLSPSGSAPLLGFGTGTSTPSGDPSFWTSLNGLFSLGSPAPVNQGALALSGPLGGAAQYATPASVAGAQAAQNASQQSSGSTSFLYSLGALATSILAPAQQNTPSTPTTGTIPASYYTTPAASTGGINIMELVLIAAVAFGVYEMAKR
ncbi:MAG: hypothetical protein GC186_16495 [Rhodobacteraceae bacterium]|nr:hypothetical protein [Paracoccaceae bacterium]